LPRRTTGTPAGVKGSENLSPTGTVGKSTWTEHKFFNTLCSIVLIKAGESAGKPFYMLPFSNRCFANRHCHSSPDLTVTCCFFDLLVEYLALNKTGYNS